MPDPPAQPPIRMCLGCRAKRPQMALFRVARDKGGKINTGSGPVAPGRGAYLCGSPRCVARVLKKGLLARALRGPVTPEDWIAIHAALAQWTAQRPLVCSDPEDRSGTSTE